MTSVAAAISEKNREPNEAKLDIQKPVLREARGNVETTVEIVTPQKAVEWTSDEVNTHNRSIDDRRVLTYARDMQHDNWQYNNDSICFDANGVLLNGQHRLHACIMAQKPFKTTVIRGLPSNAQDTMDQHRVRSISGMLQLRGHARCAHLGGSARHLINIAHAADGYQSYRPSNQEILTLVEAHPLLVDSVTAAKHCPRGVSPSVLAALHYIAKTILNHGERADAFVQVFGTGVPDYPGDPAHLFREATIRHQERKTSKIESVRFFSLIRAWNAFLERENWGKWISPAGPVSMNGVTPEMIEGKQ